MRDKKETEHHKTPQKLTFRPLTEGQQRAMELLLGGATDSEVAAAVGVCRETVWSWRRESPVFMAELEKRRAEVWGSAAEKLRSLLMRAIANLEKAVDEGSLRASVEVLKATGLYGDGQMNCIHEQDPELCFEQIVAHRLRAERIPDPMQALLDFDRNPAKAQRRMELEAELRRELEAN